MTHISYTFLKNHHVLPFVYFFPNDLCVFNNTHSGAIFLNPVYDHERVLNNLNGWFKLKNQHPYVQQYIGPPYSFQYHLSNEIPFDKYHEEYLPANAFKQSTTMEEALLRIIHGNLLDKVLDQKLRLKGFLLKEYSLDSIQERLLKEIFNEADSLCESSTPS